MALVNMKNAGILTNDQVDFKKTTSKKLSYEKIGKDLYRQVHLVTFERKDHKLLQAIVLSDASSEECSMGDAQVFVISQTLGYRSEGPVLIATSCGATRQIRTPPGLTVVLRSSNPGLQMSAMGRYC